jgi:integral membrane protein (TIGR01906 family)
MEENNERQTTTAQLWPRLVQCLLVLALPVCLLAADLRVVTSHWFVQWEYGKASFPPDPLSLSTTERAHLAEVCVDYLATNADIALLAELQLPDGEVAFNARELRHMADVQAVYSRIMVAGIVAGVVLLGGITALLVAGYAHKHDVHSYAAAALLKGSLLTLALLGGMGAFMALSWDSFFVAFHRAFFKGETWIFPYSDTLIRLFPVRFWMDVGTMIVGILLFAAVAIGVGGWIWMRRIRFET